ncbi:MAG: prephenate dehydrogenase/arogenate dehydrogenase family protein [Planctomycetes bacterium]|nr:prephenate dehydrogenase/arogenate dehydrogenase family protein [Planctomycetota bacterium]
MALLRCLPEVAVMGYARRRKTREKAGALGSGFEVTGSLEEAVSQANLVILASPVCTFESIFKDMAPFLPDQCIVTDVGSTKVEVHHWAAAHLPGHVIYVGSHPMAGSEQSGLEYARDDLFERALCLITHRKSTPQWAVDAVSTLWQTVGCRVENLLPDQHDRIVARISHVPHVMAAALMNASHPDDLDYTGKGFVDTSRVASGPEDVWTDILLTNAQHVSRGIDKTIAELTRLKTAIQTGRRSRVMQLLNRAREKRAKMIEDKISRKELL